MLGTAEDNMIFLTEVSLKIQFQWIVPMLWVQVWFVGLVGVSGRVVSCFPDRTSELGPKQRQVRQVRRVEWMSEEVIAAA